MNNDYSHYSNFNMSLNDFEQERKGEPVGFVNDSQSFLRVYLINNILKEYMLQLLIGLILAGKLEVVKKSL